METSAPTQTRPKLPYWNVRRRIYLVWGVVVAVGFVTTHFYQMPNINWVWMILSVIGLGYMAISMNLKVKRFRNIFLVWLATISLCMIVSYLAVTAVGFAWLVEYLGPFWLVLMGLGHWANGLVDPPAREYWTSGAFQVMAGVACMLFAPFLAIQYIVAAAVGTLGMVWLILYR